MRKIKAKLVATPSAEQPYKVIVMRDDIVLAEKMVSSKVAGEAMVLDIEKTGKGGRLDL